MNTSVGELFDRDAEFDQWEQTRPHRHQRAAICFLTMRLDDSIPKVVIERWDRERTEWLRRLGIGGDDWRLGRKQLPASEKAKFQKHFDRARETTLDEGLGCCVLQDRRAAKIVAKSLRTFHGDRYWMGDFVVMPNHVHMLVAFADNEAAKRQPGGWMRFTARQINRLANRAGGLWFEEPFDHLVRSETQLKYLRNYIRDNPAKAKLSPGRYLYCPSSGHF